MMMIVTFARWNIGLSLFTGHIHFFQFLLRQAFANDEASTRLLQILLFLLVSTASLMFIPCAVRSSFTLSVHFFGCLPVLLVPFTCPYRPRATADICFPPSLLRARTTSAFFS